MDTIIIISYLPRYPIKYAPSTFVHFDASLSSLVGFQDLGRNASKVFVYDDDYSQNDHHPVIDLLNQSAKWHETMTPYRDYSTLMTAPCIDTLPSIRIG